VVNATPRPLYPPVKRHDTPFSTVGWAGLATGLDGYGKYQINWDSNTEYSRAYRVATPNTLSRPQIFNAVSNKLPYY